MAHSPMSLSSTNYCLLKDRSQVEAGGLPLRRRQRSALAAERAREQRYGVRVVLEAVVASEDSAVAHLVHEPGQPAVHGDLVVVHIEILHQQRARVILSR